MVDWISVDDDLPYSQEKSLVGQEGYDAEYYLVHLEGIVGFCSAVYMDDEWRDNCFTKFSSKVTDWLDGNSLLLPLTIGRDYKPNNDTSIPWKA